MSREADRRRSGGPARATGGLPRRQRTRHEADAQRAALQFLDLGRHLNDIGEFAAAAEELGQAIRLDPTNADAHAVKGWALENLGRDHLAEAKGAYERALELEPKDLWAREGLANVLRRLGDRDEALRHYREVADQARARTAEEADLLELLGWCQYRLNLHGEAARTFEEALSVDESWISVRFDLALTLLCGGDRRAAVAQYERAVADAAGWDRMRRRGLLHVAVDDLEEALAEHPELAGTAEAHQVRGRLRAALDASQPSSPGGSSAAAPALD